MSREPERPGVSSLGVSSVSALPSLRAYLCRIGAEVISFRRAEVREATEDGYKRVVATIRIQGEHISCDDKDRAPSPAELAAIKAELKDANFPRSINARSLEALPVDPQGCFVFWSSTGKEVLFVQQRVLLPDGKADLPWSYWSDGTWRRMEPDGELPLFGLERLKDKSTVFLHEGAKAARDVQRMVDGAKPGPAAERAAHPWASDLMRGVHLGWPGGAYGARRVDWEPIRRLPPQVEVILVCDNDRPGKAAATTISRLLQRPLRLFFSMTASPRVSISRIRFRKEMGKHVGGETRTGGASGKDLVFDDYVLPATWATVTIETGRKGRPPHAVRKEFAAEWYFVDHLPFSFTEIEAASAPHRQRVQLGRSPFFRCEGYSEPPGKESTRPRLTA